VKMLRRKIRSEMRSKWVSERIENLSKEQLQALYVTADQEFKNGDEERRLLARKILTTMMQGVYKYIKHLRFLNVAANYLNFLKAVPKIVDLQKHGITEEQWKKYVEDFIQNFNNKQISMNDL